MHFWLCDFTKRVICNIFSILPKILIFGADVFVYSVKIKITICLISSLEHARICSRKCW